MRRLIALAALVSATASPAADLFSRIMVDNAVEKYNADQKGEALRMLHEAARWKNGDAISLLTQMKEPVPEPDLYYDAMMKEADERLKATLPSETEARALAQTQAASTERIYTAPTPQPAQVNTPSWADQFMLGMMMGQAMRPQRPVVNNYYETKQAPPIRQTPAPTYTCTTSGLSDYLKLTPTTTCRPR